MRLLNTCIYLLIACFPFAAHAAKKIDFNSIGQTKNGPVAKFGPTGNIDPTSPVFDSRIPVRNINLGGEWQPAGNYGAARDALRPSNAQLRANGEVFFPGTRYPFQAGYQVPPSLILNAVTALCSNPIVCVAVTVGSPYLLEWFRQSGVRPAPADATHGMPFEVSDPSACTVAPCLAYHAWGDPNPKVSPDPLSALNQLFVHFKQLRPTYSYAASGSCFDYDDKNGGCPYTETAPPVGGQPSTPGGATAVYDKIRISPSGVLWQPASMDDIAPYMDKPMDPKIFKELLDKGANFELPLPTVTGPASTEGEEVTTINPDGSKTVSKTKYNFQTSGNTVTNTDKSTTTTTFNIDNSVRNVSTTTTVPSPSAPNEKEDKDPCKENPETVGCMKTDEPEVPDLETKEKPITFTPDSGWGPSTGSCPAPRHLVSGTGADFSFTPYCDFMTALRPVLLAVAWLSGAMILIGANRKE